MDLPISPPFVAVFKPMPYCQPSWCRCNEGVGESKGARSGVPKILAGTHLLTRFRGAWRLLVISTVALAQQGEI